MLLPGKETFIDSIPETSDAQDDEMFTNYRRPTLYGSKLLAYDEFQQRTTKNEKYKAILDEIQDCYRQGQPILVGTITVETSEILSRLLKRRKVPHQVLNARYHQQEAEPESKAVGAGQPDGVALEKLAREEEPKNSEQEVSNRVVTTSFKAS